MNKSVSLFTLFGAMIMLAGCSNKENVVADQAEELPLVEIDAVHRQDVPQSKSYTATVEADNTNNIAPSVAKRITAINVEVGDHVRKGQTLVTLDDANLTQIKVQLDQAKREYDRAAKLLEIGSGTQQAVDQAQATYDGLLSQYHNMVENTVLTSPINGVVTARNYDPGDMTGTQPVLTVGQITPQVKVMINVTENDLSKVKARMPVTVTFDAYPDEVFSGRIARVYPTVDPSTRTFQCEILVSNPQTKILPGMFARVGIELGNQSNVVVPDRAIVKQTGSGNKYVYVYRDGRVSFHKVELGQRMGNRYELTSGIEDGDSVVISGQSRLADGVAVEVIRK